MLYYQELMLKNKNLKKINVAVIGLGYWGPNLLRNFVEINDYNVKYGCDLIEENLNKNISKYPSIKFTKNYSEILEDKEIDLIAIATPLSTHFKLAKLALLAKKHVLLEKPMTQNSKQAAELIRISEKVKKILMVGYTFVYSDSIRKIKKTLDNKDLGQIYYYDSTRINLGLIQKDINVIWDLACHDLSIINYLFKNKPISIQSFGSKFTNNNQEEIGHLIINFQDNLTAHINASWLSPVKIRSIIIGGSKKMITFDDISPNEKIRVYNKSIEFNPDNTTPFKPAYRSGDIIIPYIEQNESLKNELIHLKDCIIKGFQPITNGDEGIKILKLLEASNYSLKSKKIVNL